MSSRLLLEVCVGSVDDAVAAVAGGADRLEVNFAVSLGGLTPSAGLFAEVRRRVTVPVIAMVRPRPGGFLYSATDFEVMRRDAEALIDAGADGLAFGVLTAGGNVDVARCRDLLAVCGDRAAVFHRAFDLTPDPLASLESLIGLGFRRIMSSGQAESAVAGTDLIARLVRRAAGRIEVLPAGGIRAETVGRLLIQTGCGQVHAGPRAVRRDPSVDGRPSIHFGPAVALSEGDFDQTDASAVGALRQALDR